MSIRFALVTLLAVSGATAASEPGLQDAIQTALHRIEPAPGGFTAFNPTQHLDVRFTGGRAEFSHNGKRFSLSLVGESAVSRANALGNRLDLVRAGVTEWFVNRNTGLEHGFTVASRRAAGPLVLTLQVTGDYHPEPAGADIVFRGPAENVLRYAGLRSWDASGRSLPSRAEVTGSRIRLVVDDRGAAYPVTVDPTVQEPALTAPDGAAGDQFGAAVAMSGNTAVVGAKGKNNVGAVYVFTRSGGTWTEQASLTPTPPPAPNSLFGYSVAISGDTIVIGAPGENAATGAIYTFTRTAGQWSQQARIAAFDGVAPDQFGWSVAISGDTVLAGAPNRGLPLGGVYVYTRAAGAWSQQAFFAGSKIPKPNNNNLWSNFGWSVALDGDTAAVGGVGDIAGTDGGVWVYTRSGTLWTLQVTLASPAAGPMALRRFGSSVAVSADTLLVGEPYGTPNAAGDAYVFTRSGAAWSLQATLTGSDAAAGDHFGLSVALDTDTAIAGAPGKSGNTGAAYAYTRTGTIWSETKLTLPQPIVDPESFGGSVAVSGGAVLVGAGGGNSTKGAVDIFRLSNVSLSSNPSGRTFTLTGAGCGGAGSFSTPYTGLWSNCTVQWTSPDATAADTRFTFQRWSDGDTSNPRALLLNPDPKLPATALSVDFLTEYLLTTQSIPVSGGTVTGAGWYAANANPLVAAIPNAGFVFTGFAGALSGVTTPQTVALSGPKTVTGSFTTTPPAILSGIVSAKSGSASSRLWTISLNNTGPGTAFNTQLFVLMFVQTFGAPCTAMPVRLMPAVLPVSLGSLTAGTGAQTQALLDFSGCPANARFTVSVGYMSNGGASGGVIQLVNQFQ